MAGLEEYYKKRDFAKTAEPRGGTKEEGQNRFCIQHHHASHKHYDLRIEHDGVLLSWAIPKGPSADPETKRLAMETEPHPIEYLTFEGTIPKGEYGAGKMIVWDIGHFEIPGEDDPEAALEHQYKKGSIDLSFEGRKMKGQYKLVQTNKEKRQWLFFKKKDEYAGKDGFSAESVLSGRKVEDVEEENNPVARVMKKAPEADFPADFKPMLAKLSDTVFGHEDWIYEVKYDGYRCLLFKNGEKTRLLSRNGNLLNKNYPDLVEAAKDLYPDGVFDGEIIVADETGGGNFELLQQYLSADEKQPLRLILFDLIWFQGRDLSSLPLLMRKAVLENIMQPIKNGRLKYSSHITARGEAYLEAAKKLGLEGIIAKKANSSYQKNKRSNYWLKFKNVEDEDLPVVGVTSTEDSGRAFGALLLARLNARGKLQYAGKVGTGFSASQTKAIRKKLEQRKTGKAPVETKQKALFWTEPHFLAQVRYTEKTRDGRLRHPSFQALRDDKFFEDEPEKPKSKPKTSKEIDNPKSPEIATRAEGLKFTNPGKEFFPESGITKGDVIEYYERVSPLILPHLKDRPITLRRHPNGIKDQGFYQKNVEGEVPDFVETTRIESKSSEGKSITYALCNNVETLLFLANWGCVEMHVTNSRHQHWLQPDHIVFDLDPVGEIFDQLKEAAFSLKEMLERWEIPHGLKTSGSRGLHLYVPVENRYTHEQVRHAAHVIAQIWHRKLPELTSLERMPARRQDKVYLDYLQNGRSRTMAAPYSLRVKPKAPVSMPITWEELEGLKSVQDYHLQNVAELLKKPKDPWEGLYAKRITLESLVEKIEVEVNSKY